MQLPVRSRLRIWKAKRRQRIVEVCIAVSLPFHRLELLPARDAHTISRASTCVPTPVKQSATPFVTLLATSSSLGAARAAHNETALTRNANRIVPCALSKKKTVQSRGLTHSQYCHLSRLTGVIVTAMTFFGSSVVWPGDRATTAYSTMRITILLASLSLSLRSAAPAPPPVVTDRPIIGVLTVPGASSEDGGCITATASSAAAGGDAGAAVGSSCFHAYYVKWLEAAGARIVPISCYAPFDEIDAAFAVRRRGAWGECLSHDSRLLLSRLISSHHRRWRRAGRARALCCRASR